MRRIALLWGIWASLAAIGNAQTTFVYPQGYPKGCGDQGPTIVGGAYNFGDRSVCTIPDLRPPGNFVPPAPGETYVDPNLGYTVRISGPTGWLVQYHSQTAVSATGKYIALMDPLQGGMTDIYDRLTGKVVKDKAGNSQDWGFWWDPADDDVYYTVTWSAPPWEFYKMSVTNTFSKRTVFSVPYAGITGGTASMSRDKYFGFYRADVKQVCVGVLDGSNRAWCAAQPATWGGSNGADYAFDFAMVSKGKDPNGKRYLLAEQGGHIYELDEAAGTLTEARQFQNFHTNHLDCVEVQGKQFLFAGVGGDLPDKNGNKTFGGFLALVPFDGGPWHYIMRVSYQSPIGNGMSDVKYGCSIASPVCVVGAVNSTPLQDTDPAMGTSYPTYNGPYAMEAIHFNFLTTDQVEARRLAKIRTVLWASMGGSDYYSTPMCNVNANGKVVACNSNFGFKPATPHPKPEKEGGTRRPITIDVDLPRPPVTPKTAANAASFEPGPGIAPGSSIAIFGAGLSDFSEAAGSASLPLSLAGVSVSFDVPSAGLSFPGHLYYVSPEQVNVQAPWELAGQSSAQMKVSIGDLSGTLDIAVSPYAPAVFEYTDPVADRSLAAAFDENAQLIGSAHRALPGHSIQFYMNGLGPVSNQPASGEPASGPLLSQTLVQPAVTIGGRSAVVEFSALAPALTGMYQVNVIVPPDTPGGLQPVVVSVGGIVAKEAQLPVEGISAKVGS